MRKLFLVLFLVAVAMPAWACFGPKLYIGVQNGIEGELRFALVSLYIKEKTGVEAVQVDLAGRNPQSEVVAEKVDLAFSPTVGEESSVLRLTDSSVLLAGKRVREDLQFTTVLPALAKLQKVIEGADWPMLLARVQAGEGALAVARAFYKNQGAL